MKSFLEQIEEANGPSSLILSDAQMNNDNEIQPYVTNGGPSHFEMDEAFCVRMRAAIAAGLESASIGVITAPGTRKPRYVPAKQS